jgi:hypothetical protein
VRLRGERLLAFDLVFSGRIDGLSIGIEVSLRDTQLARQQPCHFEAWTWTPTPLDLRQVTPCHPRGFG